MDGEEIRVPVIEDEFTRFMSAQPPPAPAFKTSVMAGRRNVKLNMTEKQHQLHLLGFEYDPARHQFFHRHLPGSWNLGAEVVNDMLPDVFNRMLEKASRALRDPGYQYARVVERESNQAGIINHLVSMAKGVRHV